MSGLNTLSGTPDLIAHARTTHDCPTPNFSQRCHVHNLWITMLSHIGPREIRILVKGISPLNDIWKVHWNIILSKTVKRYPLDIHNLLLAAAGARAKVTHEHPLTFRDYWSKRVLARTLKFSPSDMYRHLKSRKSHPHNFYEALWFFIDGMDRATKHVELWAADLLRDPLNASPSKADAWTIRHRIQKAYLRLAIYKELFPQPLPKSPLVHTNCTLASGQTTAVMYPNAWGQCWSSACSKNNVGARQCYQALFTLPQAMEMAAVLSLLKRWASYTPENIVWQGNLPDCQDLAAFLTRPSEDDLGPFDGTNWGEMNMLDARRQLAKHMTHANWDLQPVSLGKRRLTLCFR